MLKSSQSEHREQCCSFPVLWVVATQHVLHGQRVWFGIRGARSYLRQSMSVKTTAAVTVKVQPGRKSQAGCAHCATFRVARWATWASLHTGGPRILFRVHNGTMIKQCWDLREVMPFQTVTFFLSQRDLESGHCSSDLRWLEEHWHKGKVCAKCYAHTESMRDFFSVCPDWKNNSSHFWEMVAKKKKG